MPAYISQKELQNRVRIHLKFGFPLRLDKYKNLADKREYDKIPQAIRPYYSSGAYNIAYPKKESGIPSPEQVHNYIRNELSDELVKDAPWAREEDKGIGFGGWAMIIIFALVIIQVISSM